MVTQRESYRLSPEQRRVWERRPGHGAGAVGIVLRLDGEIDAERLRRAVAAVAERHAVLHTRYERTPGLKVPDQVPDPALEPAWAALDVDPDAGGDAAMEALRAAVGGPFDLERGPVLRAALAGRGTGGALLALILPELSADAATVRLLAERVLAAHAGVAPEAEGAPFPRVAEWQNVLLADDREEDARAARSFWDGTLSPPVVWSRLPLELPEGSATEGDENPVEVHLSGDVWASLERTAEARRVAGHELLSAAWAVLAWRLGGRRDVALGCVAPGRSLEVLETLLGPLAREVPLVLPVRGDETLAEVAGEVRDRLAACEPHLDPLDPTDSRLPEAFPMGFSREAAPAGDGAGATRPPWLRRRARFGVELRVAAGGPGAPPRLPTLSIAFDPARHRRADVARYAKSLGVLLADAAERPEAPVAALTLESGDRPPVVSAASRSGGPEAPVHRWVARWAGEEPERTAVSAAGVDLSYRRLDEDSDRLARHLAARGVGRETTVGLLVGRTPELVVALVAVLKAGGCYVPIDPRLPRARRDLILRHAGIRVVVTGDGTVEWLEPPAEVVRLDADRAAWSAEPDVDPGVAVDPDQLAYVLFTSGSTGEPKGVAVSHRQLAGYVAGALEELAVEPGEIFAMVSSFGADLGNTSLFGALAAGGTVLIAGEDEVGDPAALAHRFRERPPGVLKIVPSHLRALLAGSPSRDLLPARRLVLGGEALDRELARRVAELAPECRVINHYGPTETTVGALAWTVDPEATPVWAHTVPIGSPLPGYCAAVADPDLRPVPVGVPGELLVGGVGVARGYRGRPAVTAERFVPDPWSGEPGGRVYRTGDLVRRLPGGLVEFVGRIDDQVKIRGFRVEPGEVAAAVAAHPGVREAAVVARDDEAGHPQLLACVVAASGGAPDLAGLRTFLAERLPEHMVPGRLAVLPKLPLTSNGKLDRAALAESETLGDRPAADLVEPRDEAEEILAGAWRHVLRLERVGVHDNFFALGGDSILGIQVIARANQAGLRLAPRQIFEHQTIAELAAAAERSGPVAPAGGPIAGPVPLSPIQRWFFEREIHDRHHWNQAVALRCRRRLDRASVTAAIGTLIETHDALRLRFERDGASWRQRCAPPGGPSPVIHVDLAALGGAGEAAGFAVTAQRVQRSLDLSRGPLLRAALFDHGPARPQKLLVVIHHLAVDGVSWRILLSDLAVALEQLEAGEPVRLQPRTTSVGRWAEVLAERAGSRELAAEVDDWTGIGSRASRPLPADHPEGRDAEGLAASLEVELGPEPTGALLRDAHDAYGTRIDDLLLAALVRALARWSGRPEHRIDLEGHGRDEPEDGLDLSRTVGWLTVRYPVALEARGPAEAGLVKGVKERLRAVRPRALHYGLLRYLADPETTGLLASLPEPEISYNYLGQLDSAFPPAAPFEPAADGVGDLRNPLSPRPRGIQVTGWIANERLRVRFKYGSERHRESTIRGLADDFLGGLEALVEHCAGRRRRDYTPSDFPLSGVDQEDLDQIVAQIEGTPAGGRS